MFMFNISYFGSSHLGSGRKLIVSSVFQGRTGLTGIAGPPGQKVHNNNLDNRIEII